MGQGCKVKKFDPATLQLCNPATLQLCNPSPMNEMDKYNIPLLIIFKAFLIFLLATALKVTGQHDEPQRGDFDLR